MERSLNRTSLWAIIGKPLTKGVGITAICEEFSWYKMLWFWRTTLSILNIVRFFRNPKFNFVSKFYVCIRITTPTWSLDKQFRILLVCRVFYIVAERVILLRFDREIAGLNIAQSWFRSDGLRHSHEQCIAQTVLRLLSTATPFSVVLWS